MFLSMDMDDSDSECRPHPHSVESVETSLISHIIARLVLVDIICHVRKARKRDNTAPLCSLGTVDSYDDEQRMERRFS